MLATGQGCSGEEGGRQAMADSSSVSTVRGSWRAERSSALKALSATAGGSQFVCFPAQVPSVCRIACAVDEHDGDGEGNGLPGWER